MRQLDYQKIISELSYPFMPNVSDSRYEGRILTVGSTLLRAHLPGVGLGEICSFTNGALAEVVAIEGEQALLSPYQEPIGISSGMLISPSGRQVHVGVGDAILGRVLDALGRPVDELPPPEVDQWRKIDSEPPPPMQRSIIDTLLTTGIKSIDATLTVGIGQRLGIFAPAGCGKSTLLGMLAANSEVDVVVLALIGERGKEVREFLEQVMTPKLRACSVVVVSTSDRPALERIKAAATATSLAEYFRDRGNRVLLLVDSLTRYARAIREIAMAAGEPTVVGGYPASLYARLPRLLERAGATTAGSITAFYTVLMEEKGDTLAEEVRSLLDGHIILSRRMAEANHFPAIDVLSSISRAMHKVAHSDHKQAAGRLRRLLATWKEVELLVRVGEYRQGQDQDADDAIACRAAINSFLCQSGKHKFSLDSTLSALYEAIGGNHAVSTS